MKGISYCLYKEESLLLTYPVSVRSAALIKKAIAKIKLNKKGK